MDTAMTSKEQVSAFLQANYRPSETVRIVTGYTIGAKGKANPMEKPGMPGQYYQVDELLNRLNGSEPLEEIIKGIDPKAGAWIGVNPTSGMKDENVTAIRNMLIECDDVSREVQLQNLRAAGIPFTTLTDSGSKSIHAIVRFDNINSKEQYKIAFAAVEESLSHFGINMDKANSNPGRLTRLPGVKRGNGFQTLYEAHPDAGCFPLSKAVQDRLNGIKQKEEPLPIVQRNLSRRKEKASFKGNAPADPWDGSPIPSGQRHTLILSHLGYWVKLTGESSLESIETEARRIAKACEEPFPESELLSLIKQAVKDAAELAKDPNYIPDPELYKIVKTQEAAENNNVIRSWEGISENELRTIGQVNLNVAKNAKVIRRFNGDFKRLPKDRKTWPGEDIRTLIWSARLGNVPTDEIKGTVLSVFKHSQAYLHRQADLDTVLPEEGLTVLETVIRDTFAAMHMENASSVLPTYKDERGSFLHELAAQEFVQAFECRYHGPSHQFLVWLDGYYTSDPDAIDRAVITQFMANSKAAQRKEMLTTAKALCERIEKDPDRRFIAFQNGVLDIKTDEFQDSSPDMFFMNIIPHDYVADPEPIPVLDETLKTWACGDEDIIQNILEMSGHCMYRGNEDLQYFFCLTGSGSNGKSVLISLLRTMLGKQNVSSVPIQGLEEKFTNADLFGVLANIAAENEAGYIRKTAVLKASSAGDLIQIQRKNAQPFSFECNTTNIFSWNVLPRFSDETGAVKRRIVPIPFRAKFVDDPDQVRPDKHIYPKNMALIAQLRDEKCIQYFIRKAITALQQALELGGIVKNAAGNDALEEMDSLNNHVRMFVEEMREQEEDDTARGDHVYPEGKTLDCVYEDYLVFCKEQQIRNKNKAMLSKNLKDDYNLKTIKFKDSTFGRPKTRRKFVRKNI